MKLFQCFKYLNKINFIFFLLLISVPFFYYANEKFRAEKKYFSKDRNAPDFIEKSFSLGTRIFVTQNDLANAIKQDEDWLHANGNYSQTRFYPGNEINDGNVKNLKFKFTLETDVIGPIQSAPLVSKGIIFVSTAFNNIYAFDGLSGKKLWHFKYHNLKGDNFPYNCCGPNNRGLAIANNQLFMGTLDGHLISVNAETGKLIWNVSLLDRNTNSYGYSATSSPIVVDNKVIIGIGDGEFAVRGFLKAFNVADGHLLWKFYTIPSKGQEGVWAEKDVTGHLLGRDIEKEKKLFYSSGFKPSLNLGGGVWNPPSVDLDSRTLFFVVGNPYPDFDGETRPGDNLYTDSMVAIDLDSGKYKWHFQYIPHDIWDLDAASPTILADVIDHQGNKVKAVIHAGKIGNLFVHRRDNGKLITLSEPMIYQRLWSKNKLGSHEKGSPIPDMESGVNWSPLSLNPKLNIAYAMNRFKNPDIIDKHGFHKFTGKLAAVDINSGKIIWSFKTDIPLQGGVLSTEGNLIFFGDGDGYIYALHALNGEVLWKYRCDAGANGVPSTYKVGGKQYIAMGCGGNFMWNFRRGNKFYIFSL